MRLRDWILLTFVVLGVVVGFRLWSDYMFRLGFGTAAQMCSADAGSST